MENEIKDLVVRLTDPSIDGLDIISWASPIPTFGDIDNSKIATLGLNPSDKEFIGNDGEELSGNKRRFHTLKSLAISDWHEISEKQISLLVNQCKDYFSGNPYDNWFKKLDYLISGTSHSYYFPSNEACHLDLVPFATSIKWGKLKTSKKNILLNNYGDILGLLIKDSPIKILVLNGSTVIENLQKISNINLVKKLQPNWQLPRRGSSGINGYSYQGLMTNIGGIDLGKKILILGFNHNIQSSFGVTSAVQAAIRNWITEQSKPHL